MASRKSVVAIAFGMIAFAFSAKAEQPYDITTCFAGTVTVLTASDELTVTSVEMRGITQSHLENKAFDNTSVHCVGVGQSMPDKSIRSGYCKYLDPEGDFLVGRYEAEGAEGKWEFVHGTGKWKGITGGGTYEAVTRAKPITPGTFQYCSRATGTFSLPK
jgi:hypothetical protein